MAAVVTADELPSDLERGQGRPKSTRAVSYVRDITYKVLPCFIVCLVLLSAGGILVATVTYNKPLPRDPVIVISSMLLVFLVLAWIGLFYLYRLKRFPPLTRGPNAPDRPAPVARTWKDRVKRCCELIIEKLSDDDSADEPEPNLDPPPPSTPPPPPPGTSNNPAELARFEDQEVPRQVSIGQPYYSHRNNITSTRGADWPPHRRPVGSGSNHNPPQPNHTIPNGVRQSDYTRSPDPRRGGAGVRNLQAMFNVGAWIYEQMGASKPAADRMQDPRDIERARDHRSQTSAYHQDPQGDNRPVDGSFPTPSHPAATISPTRAKPNGPRDPRPPSRATMAEYPRAGPPGGPRIHWAYIPDSSDQRALAGVLSCLYILLAHQPTLAAASPAKRSMPHGDKSGPRTQTTPPAPLKASPHLAGEEKEPKQRENPRTMDDVRRHIAKLSMVLLQLLDEACLEEEELLRGRKLDRLRRASVDLPGKAFSASDQRESRRSTDSGERSVSPPSTAGSAITVSTLDSEF
ncbi:uncharacterized protein F4812DRAFT_73179 [Daldinia caldariorum]|uniref:uncharacterized protein n=1 Tax=Daldinia caldariorum TaxID=326644 RepID=UPI0020088404|nr:uncharacterized protein F4812DRAFT_73179 [Daldinia caldariorum]KAI1466294.1 hypothetical protein F4812DRAFT_73179 [Daldinia caldariorum]